MASVLNIPDKRDAVLRTVQIPVTTKDDGGEQITSEFDAELPASLVDAVATEGEREVFRRYINSKVITLQANERRRLVGKESKGRVRAKYMEDLGI